MDRTAIHDAAWAALHSFVEEHGRYPEIRAGSKSPQHRADVRMMVDSAEEYLDSRGYEVDDAIVQLLAEKIEKAVYCCRLGSG